MANWRKILGWCILSPFIVIISYVLIMSIIAKPMVLIGLGFVSLFALGINLIID